MLGGVQRLHLIGIGGIGVSGVARLLSARGYIVQGSDVRESNITQALRHEGIDVFIGHHKDNLGDSDLVVVSTAIPTTNPEWIAASEAGIPVVHRAEVLGQLVNNTVTFAMIGTHGKGTVTSMVAWIMECAGWDPSFFIGANCHNFDTNARLRTGPYVIEVDESDGSLVHIRPTHLLLNNLELDHLNYYSDWDKLANTISKFVVENQRLEHFVANFDDDGVQRLLWNIEGGRLIGFGFVNENAEYRGEVHEERGLGTRFLVRRGSDVLGEIELPVPGLYNAQNGLGAVALTHSVGIDFAVIQQALASFRGLENRFTLAEAGGVQVVKDYISHPTGIRRVLEAASRIAAGPITAVFKPYRFTMIHYLQDEYRECFRLADHTIVTEMYTAGEVPIPGVDTEFLCDKIRESGSLVTYIQDMDKIVPYLLEHVSPGEQVLFFGGDDLFRLADHYLATLRVQEQNQL